VPSGLSLSHLFHSAISLGLIYNSVQSLNSQNSEYGNAFLKIFLQHQPLRAHSTFFSSSFLSEMTVSAAAAAAAAGMA
jgi:hypothetical protein